MGGEQPRVTFGCCFCGQEITEEPKHALILDPHPGEDYDDWQQWWCHKQCLADKLVREARAAMA